MVCPVLVNTLIPMLVVLLAVLPLFALAMYLGLLALFPSRISLLLTTLLPSSKLFIPPRLGPVPLFLSPLRSSTLRRSLLSVLFFLALRTGLPRGLRAGPVKWWRS